MLLTVDVGNTNITLGLFKGDKVYATFRITTQMARTSDEYGSLIAEMIARKGIDIQNIRDVIISSVVPKVMYSLNNGVTSPGIRICAKALWNETAKLPEIEIKKPDTILAKDTITSMQAGIVYGYIGQTEYIIDKMKEESGLNNLKVIATGGMGRIICENTDKIDVYDNELTLQGMRIIYEKNRKK